MTTDAFRHHTIAELEQMSLPEVEAAWEQIPPERQSGYRNRYERYLRETQATSSDAEEQQALDGLLRFYQDRRIVPYGANWTVVPENIVQAAISNVDLRPVEETEGTKVKKVSPIFLVLAGLVVLLMAFLLIRTVTGRNTAADPRRATATRARYTPTSTPLAIDVQDAIIRGSDTEKSGLTTIFPVNLRIAQPDQAQPRVFIVQRKAVTTTEWDFDDNPDTASYLAGLVVRRVIGIPWSEENQALFSEMNEATTFTLQMNTGTRVQYRFTQRETVNRSDTTMLRQASPGLVLILVGERDPETDEPTPLRMVVTAAYDYEQELSRGVLAGFDLPVVATNTPTLIPTPAERVDVQIVSAQTQADTLTLQLRIYNDRLGPIRLDSDSMWITYGYTERPSGPRVSVNVPTTTVLPGQAVDLTVTLAWTGHEPYALLSVLNEYRFTLSLS